MHYILSLYAVNQNLLGQVTQKHNQLVTDIDASKTKYEIRKDCPMMKGTKLCIMTNKLDLLTMTILP